MGEAASSEELRALFARFADQAGAKPDAIAKGWDNDPVEFARSVLWRVRWHVEVEMGRVCPISEQEHDAFAAACWRRYMSGIAVVP